MYIVEKIHAYAVTNFIILLNLDTGTKDKCFDDSSLKGMECFDFIQEGEVYDCKIELFGEFVDQSVETSTEVAIVETGVLIGETRYLKVLVGYDVYYILESDAKGHEIARTMYYNFTRKDLIQVDDVIHADCL